MYNYEQEDQYQRSILYRPKIQNMKIDKKFARKKHQIFQILNIKKSTNLKTNYNHDLKQNNQFKQDSLSSLVQKSNPNNEKVVQLPNIYLYSKPKHKQLIGIEQKQKLIKQISRKLNFVNKKTPILNINLQEIIKQETKSVSYDSDVYKKQLQLLNGIFSDCGIMLKNKDFILIEGNKSKTKYSIFTNHIKHPQSICCQSQVYIKNIQFMSYKNYKFSKQKSFEFPVKNIVSLCCMKCQQQIIKIRPDSSNQHNIFNQVNNKSISPLKITNQYQQEKRLLQYSKLISSGRFKKALINDKSVELMNSRQLMKNRNLSTLNRSKTSLTKLNRLSNSHNLHDKSNIDYIHHFSNSKEQNSRYHLHSKQDVSNKNNSINQFHNMQINNVKQINNQKYTNERDNRVKSYQQSIKMKRQSIQIQEKKRRQNIKLMLQKRKNNISQVLMREDKQL